jgi:electron transport complex protein RnfE
MMKNGLARRFIDRNPVFSLALGLCPALAVTTSVYDALCMGLCVFSVMIASNIMVSLTRNLIPKKVHVPCHILIVATFAVMVEIIMKHNAPALSNHLGIYLPLVAVNSLVLERADFFASKNGVFASLLDGIVMGIGFVIALFLCALVREFLGSYSIFGQKVVPSCRPMLVFSYACGGFFSIALLLGIINFLRLRKEKAKA